MIESGYYPPGADNEFAPWNQIDVPEKEFDVCVSQTLSRSTTIETSDYSPEYDDEDGHTYYNTEETDWKQAYKEASYTPLQIITMCDILAEYLMDQGVKRIGKIYLPYLHEACEGWDEDDYEVIEE